MKKIFVSYSRRDRAFAERLARDLDDAGLEVWIDFRKIEGGALWQESIFTGISQSEAMVICLSHGSVESEWVRRELLLARSQHKFVVPVMLADCFAVLHKYDETRWLQDIQIINFEIEGYEKAFPKLLRAIPGISSVQESESDTAEISCPFKGLEAFQQTDAGIFFGREDLVERLLERLRSKRVNELTPRFLAVVGASGSGKSSLVRAGLIPSLRAGKLPASETWPIAIFNPGPRPIEAMATRLLPVIGGNRLLPEVISMLEEGPDTLHQLSEGILTDLPRTARFVLVVDQFEETFSRASKHEAEIFINLLHKAITTVEGRTSVVLTMRADFFDRLSAYPDIAALFEQENMLIVTEMTPANLRRSIEGPAARVGLVYDPGLCDRVLEDVRQQPGSLPLLQYALKALFERREGRRLTQSAYEAIGGVHRALAQHAEEIFIALDQEQKDIMRRVMLRLVDVSETGESTRRKVDRNELNFKDTSPEAVGQLLTLLTVEETRLLVSSREISTKEEEEAEPTVWLEISHEALIREWERFRDWITENEEQLRYGSKLLVTVRDWEAARRDDAYLLAGNRLARAVTWLETADANELQRDFIQASIVAQRYQEAIEKERQARELNLQRQSANRLRYLAIGLTLFLVVAMSLMLLSFSLYQQSEQRREESDQRGTAVAQRAQVVHSYALSEAANDLKFADRLLAMSLAVEANTIDDPPAESQRVLAEIGYSAGAQQVFRGHTDWVRSVAFSPDGAQAISGAYDGTAILWSVDDGRRLATFAAHEKGVRSVAFGPNADVILTAGCGEHNVNDVCVQGELKLWSLETRKVIQTFSGHEERVNTVAFSPDGKSVLSGSYDQHVMLWDVSSGEILRVFEGHTGPVWSVAFSPDGTQVLSGSDDNSLILWDTASGKRLHQFKAPGIVWSVAFHPHSPWALSGSDDGTLILWDLADGNILRTFGGHPGRVMSVTFSPDGQQALSGADDKTVRRWNVSKGELLDTLYGHMDVVVSVAFSPDGEHVLSGSSDNLVIYWDAYSREESDTIIGHGRTVWSVDINPDGTQVLSGSGDNTVRLWDTATGEIVRVVSGHTDQVRSVAFSPDGQYALSGSRDRTLILWDLTTGDRVFTLTGHADEVTSVAFSPDGQYALSGSRDRTLILWDLTNESVVRVLMGSASIIWSVAFSPNGNVALSGAEDGTLTLWNTHNGEILYVFSGHQFGVTSVSFSADGRIAVSGSFDKSLKLWRVLNDTPQHMLAWVLASRYVRELTCEERLGYFVEPYCDDTGIPVTRVPTTPMPPE